MEYCLSVTRHYQYVSPPLLHAVRNLSLSPHIAGMPRNTELAGQLYHDWQSYGFDDVKMVNYTVLLSYPDLARPNLLEIRNKSGGVVYKSNTLMEPPLTPGEDDPNIVPMFSAYSGTGNATVRTVALIEQF